MKLPKALMDNKPVLDELIVKMRYQNVDPTKSNNRACMTYKSISGIVGKSIGYCRNVCMQYVNLKLAP